MSPRRSLLLFLMMVLISVAIASVLVLFLFLTSQEIFQPRAEGINSQFGLRLTARLEKRVYRIGETVNMSLTLTNIGNQTITYAHGNGCQFDFRVYNGTNNGIFQWSDSWLRPGSFAYVTLNPGDSLISGDIVINNYHVPTLHYVWLQTCNNRTITKSLEPSKGIPVSPGTYYIVGQTGPIVEVNGKDINEYGWDKPLIETTPIEIAIVNH